MKLPVLNRVQPAGILDGLTTAIITLDSALRVTYLNSATETLFSVSRRHVQGQALSTAVPHLIEQLPRLKRAIETGTGFIERELKLRRPGDDAGHDCLTVDCTATPAQFSGPGLVLELLPLDRHLRISRDEQLLAQHRASRELIRGLAHEIKNPLGGIRGAAQLLEREFPDSEHLEYTRVIIREADRLQNLVNRLLGPNRLPQKEMVNIHEVLERVRSVMLAEFPDIAVRRDYDTSLPLLTGDREQLIQVVLNIVRNAAQAIKGSGMDLARGEIRLKTRVARQVTIARRRFRHAVQIEISDNGPGIPENMRERVFQPLISGREGGSGLGLTIAHNFITQHRGAITFDSVPGRTCFTLLLPVQDDPRAGTPAQPH